MRRSRGYAPYPVHLPFSVRPALAVGGELKNTFCLTRERYAFLSQHIGDMENYETLGFFTQMVEQLGRTFRIVPQLVAHDMHPGYLSTHYAQELAAERGLPRIAVQHHHAHVAACMAEHGLGAERQVIGVALDGTGYGPDGTIWGGEFLVAGYASFRRAAHLKALPLPGGDAAIRRPYRVALAYLWAAGLPWDEDLPPVAACPPGERAVLLRQLERGVNVVPTSSAGRLFDAVAALAGVRQEINYEARAAIELEGAGLVLPDPPEAAVPYDLALIDAEDGWTLDPAPLLRAVLAEARHGLARAIAAVCGQLRQETGLEAVALSGGVFQNVTLLGHVVALLREGGFTVYTHRLVPPNDGGIALGQAVVAEAISLRPK